MQAMYGISSKPNCPKLILLLLLLTRGGNERLVGKYKNLYADYSLLVLLIVFALVKNLLKISSNSPKHTAIVLGV